MERILNYNYIQEKVKGFSWQDIKYIYEIHYYQDFNGYYEEVFLLDIVFIIFTIGKGRIEFNPWSWPYGGSSAFRALIEYQGFKILSENV